MRAGELAQPDLRALRNHGNVFDAERRAVLGEDDGLLDVVNVIDQSDLADIDLLQALLNETAAGVGVVVGELLLDLGETQSVGRRACWDRREPGIRGWGRRSWRRRRCRERT